MNVIYRVPPVSSNTATSARCRGCELRRASDCVTICQRNRIAPPTSYPRAPTHQSCYLRSQATLNQEEFQASESSLEPATLRCAARRARWIESVVACARPRRHRRTCRGRCEVSFLKLMSQLFRDLDFGIGSEPRRRIANGVGVVPFNLEHDGLPFSGRNRPLGPSLGHSHISCQQ